MSEEPARWRHIHDKETDRRVCVMQWRRLIIAICQCGHRLYHSTYDDPTSTAIHAHSHSHSCVSLLSPPPCESHVALARQALPLPLAQSFPPPPYTHSHTHNTLIHPYLYTRTGNRRMFPTPIADPIAAKRNSVLLPHSSRSAPCASIETTAATSGGGVRDQVLCVCRVCRVLWAKRHGLA